VGQNYRDVLLQDDTLSKKIERADITAIFAGTIPPLLPPEVSFTPN
jgi:hypothetical protein